MADTYGNDIALTSDWIDLITPFAAIASTSGWVQNNGTTKIRVAFAASATKPVGGGVLLATGEIAFGTAAHVWVRSVGNTGSCAAGLTD